MRGLTLLLMLFLLSANLHAQPAVPEPILTLGRGEIVGAAWAPDGQSIWIGTTAGTWQLDTALREIAAYPHITYAALSPDETKLAGISVDGFVTIWDAVTVTEIWRDTFTPAKGVRQFAWSPDSLSLAYTITDVFEAIYIYRTSEPYPGIIGIKDAKYLAWSASSRYLAGYSGDDQHIFAYDVSDIESYLQVPLEQSYQQYDYGTTYLNWFGDSDLHWSSHGDGGSEIRWLIPSGQRAATANSPCSYNGCAYSPTTRFVAGGAFTELSVLDLQSRTELFHYSLRIPVPRRVQYNDREIEGLVEVLNPSWNNDETRLAVAIEDWIHHTIQAVVVLDMTGRTRWKQGQIGFRPAAMRWSPDNSQIIAYGMGRVALLDGQSGEIISRSEAFRAVDKVAVDADGKRLAVSDTFGDIRIIAPDRETVIAGTTFPVSKLAWQPRGYFLAILDQRGYGGGGVRLWNSAKPEDVQTLISIDERSIFVAGAQNLAWSSSGKTLVVEWQYDLIVYGPDQEGLSIAVQDYYGGQRETTHIPTEFRPRAKFGDPLELDVVDLRSSQDGLSFSGNDLANMLPTELRGMIVIPQIGWISPLTTQVATIDASGDGLIWDATTGQPLDFLADVHDLVWTHDDSTLAILRRDGSLWLQNADGLRLLWSPTIPIRAPGTLVWSGDGSTLAHTQDGVLRVWRP